MADTDSFSASLFLAACRLSKEKGEGFVHLPENDPQGPYGDAAYSCLLEGYDNDGAALPADAESACWGGNDTAAGTTDPATVIFAGVALEGMPQKRYQVAKTAHEAIVYRTEKARSSI